MATRLRDRVACLILADPAMPLAEVMRTEFQVAHPDESAVKYATHCRVQSAGVARD